MAGDRCPGTECCRQWGGCVASPRLVCPIACTVYTTQHRGVLRMMTHDILFSRAQGYLPRDLYHLDSAYGTEAELRDLISQFHDHNIKVIADIVINHRYVGRTVWLPFGQAFAN